MTTIDARSWENDSAIRATMADGVFTSITPIADRPNLPTLAPGLFDLQVNGAFGRGFTNVNSKIEDVFFISEMMTKHGVSGYLPTVITASMETLVAALATLQQATAGEDRLRAMIPGFHLEGPFLNPADGPRGAHPREYIRDADWDCFRRLQDAAGGNIRFVTLAPEVPGALALVEQLVASNVVVSLGHTAATREQIRAAVEAGATMSTHLGNGLAEMLPRHDNPIWPQLAEDRLCAAVIADGDHLPDDLLTCTARMKGPDRLILTSDAASLAGLPPGRYRDWGADLDITETGKIVLAGTPYLAGSGRFLDECVRCFRKSTGWTLRDTIRAASLNPRRLLGLPLPTLTVGQPAGEWVLIDAGGTIRLLGSTSPIGGCRRFGHRRG